MGEKRTEDLDELLRNMSPHGLSDFFKDNKKGNADERKGFSYFFKNTVEDKEIKLKDIYITAGVSESYGGKIISMEKHTTNRDLIIRLCIAGHFDLEEVDRALKLYGMNPLYSKNTRDACLIIAINNKMYDFSDIDELLEKYACMKLSKAE